MSAATRGGRIIAKLSACGLLASSAWLTACEQPDVTEQEPPDSGSAAADPADEERRHMDRIRANPEHAEAHYELGAFYLGHSMYTEALRYFSETFRLDSLHTRALLGAGEVLAVQGERERAMAVYRKAISQSPSSAAGYRRLGELYLRLQDYARAREIFNKTVVMEPGHAADHYNLGVAHSRGHAYDAAVEHMQKAVSIDPEYDLAFYSLGDIYCAKLGNCAGAVDAMEEAVRLKPERASHHVALGRIFMKLNRLEEAISSLRRAVDRDSTSSEAHIGLSLAFSRLDRDDEAALALQEALRFDPAYPEARFNLSKVYMAQGKTQEAERQMEIFSRTNRYADAIRKSRTILAGNPGRCGGQLQPGDHLLEAGFRA